MLIIEYCKEGVPVSDFEVEEVFEMIGDVSGDAVLQFSTENIFNRIRLAIAQDKAHCSDFVFRFNGVDMTINEYGAIGKWVKGFCEVNVVVCEQILRAAMDKYKAKHGG